MLNRAVNIFSQQVQDARNSERSWETDSHPGFRLVCLYCLMTLPAVAILLRLAYLQIAIPDRFGSVPDSLRVSVEPLPSRDGRILSGDGRVLAYDQEQFDVQMHYRWLEEPANPDWLRQQGRSRLAQADRRDREKLARAEQEVLSLRKAMWAELAALTGTTPELLHEERQRIQARVERIIGHVHEKHAPKEQPTSPTSPAADPTWWQCAWQTVVTTLTTSPNRPHHDPLVIQEELDYHTIINDVSLEMAAEIKSHPERYPGLEVTTSTSRQYPEGSFAAHLIGVRTPVTVEELDERSSTFRQGDPLDYRDGDRIGKTGVERTYDRYLRGLRGRRRIVRNRQGEILQTEVVREPRIGRDIVLTLHGPLQAEMEAFLDERLPAPKEPGETPRGGTVVVIDVHTGAILAMASTPRFDLNQVLRPDAETWQALQADPRHPFFPRAYQMALPPGSVFKTITSVALLEDGRINPDDTHYCQGYLDDGHPERYRCYHSHAHGETSLSDAICRSCNVYFFHAARTLGPHPIHDWAERFGFGHPTGVDLPGESGGLLPQPPVDHQKAYRLNAKTGQPWYPGDTLGLAIGQSRLIVTPLQVARMMAAVANGGYLVTPHVVRDAGPAWNAQSSAATISHPPARKIVELSPETLRQVRQGLARVVADPHGTAYKTVRTKGIAIAGKTGTAEVGNGKNDHAWFAGFVPADEPRLAFAVVMEHGGSGGSVAGPVAHRLIGSMLRHGLLSTTQLSQNR